MRPAANTNVTTYCTFDQYGEHEPYPKAHGHPRTLVSGFCQRPRCWCDICFLNNSTGVRLIWWHISLSKFVIDVGHVRSVCFFVLIGDESPSGHHRGAWGERATSGMENPDAVGVAQAGMGEAGPRGAEWGGGLHRFGGGRFFVLLTSRLELCSYLQQHGAKIFRWDLIGVVCMLSLLTRSPGATPPSRFMRLRGALVAVDRDRCGLYPIARVKSGQYERTDALVAVDTNRADLDQSTSENKQTNTVTA